MPLHVQKASIVAWNDDEHVKENRDIYREKFLKVCRKLESVLPVMPPSGGFYLWPKLPCSDIDFARELYTSENVKVLPGSYLSRNVDNINPFEYFQLKTIKTPAITNGIYAIACALALCPAPIIIIK